MVPTTASDWLLSRPMKGEGRGISRWAYRNSFLSWRLTAISNIINTHPPTREGVPSFFSSFRFCYLMSKMLTLHSALKEALLPGLVAAAFIQAHSGISKSFLGLVCCFSCGLRGFEGWSFLCVWISIVIKVTQGC